MCKRNAEVCTFCTGFSEVYLLQEQHEVPGALGTAAGRVVQWQLEEREGEAPGETEVGDGMQRWEAGGTTLREPPAPGLRPFALSTCRDRGELGSRCQHLTTLAVFHN